MCKGLANNLSVIYWTTWESNFDHLSGSFHCFIINISHMDYYSWVCLIAYRQTEAHWLEQFIKNEIAGFIQSNTSCTRKQTILQLGNAWSKCFNFRKIHFRYGGKQYPSLLKKSPTHTQNVCIVTRSTHILDTNILSRIHYSRYIN